MSGPEMSNLARRYKEYLEGGREERAFPHRAALEMSRKRREAGGGLTAAERLDSQIAHLLGELPYKLDAARGAVEEDISRAGFLSASQGWSILVASWLDILEDIVANNRTLSNVGGTAEADDTTIAGSFGLVAAGDIDVFLYDAGFLFFYGLGFGLPLILGLPDDTLSCGSENYNTLVDRYGLTNGVSGFLPAPQTSSLSSRISEFELLASSQLDCILSKEDDSLEAAEAAWALEELIAALNLRLELEEAQGSKHRSFAI